MNPITKALLIACAAFVPVFIVIAVLMLFVLHFGDVHTFAPYAFGASLLVSVRIGVGYYLSSRRKEKGPRSN